MQDRRERRSGGWARLTLAMLPASALAFAQTPAADPLAVGFAAPPQDSRARLWWHWLNGNVTPEGIRADLGWMQRVGVGGVHQFDAGPPIAPLSFIEPRLEVGGAGWDRATALAIGTANRLGLEYTTAASPGWSVTGGPWVTPAQAMKKYVWSELVVEGGTPLAAPLPAPPRQTGSFQSYADPKTRSAVARGELPDFYADAMVVAYRLPPQGGEPPVPVRVTSSSGDLDPARLRDGDYAASQIVKGRGIGQPAWVQLDYDKPVTVRGLMLGVAGAGASGGRVKPVLSASGDGVRWREAASLTGPASAVLKSYAVPAATARSFRLTLPPEPAGRGLPGFPARDPAKSIASVPLAELVLSGEAVVDRFAEKAGFSDPIDYAAAPTVPGDARTAIRLASVIDLTARLRPGGRLDWTPPKGRWRIIRLGYSLTGARNHPAPDEATGLEVDKFSPAHVEAYLDRFLARYAAAGAEGRIGPRGLQNLVIDSWESGTQNWTDDFPAQFRARRGYDLTPWLPVLTGRVVGSAAASDAFLWDYRRTLQDLLAQHYAVIRAALNRRGMHLYAEAQGDAWRAIADGMEIKARADIPMSEYWFRAFSAGPGQPALKADIKEAASVAHLAGKRIAAAESLTVFAGNDPFSIAPAEMKPVLDEMFAYGINRIALHTSVHQPLTAKAPGLTLGPFGQHLTRNETWAEQARPFFDYIARSSFLLQQGHPVAQVAYFYGEERPLAALFENGYDPVRDALRIEVPWGVGYDFINAEQLGGASARPDGRLVSAGGADYRLLHMRTDVTALSLATLERLAALVEAGAIVAGPRVTGQLGRSGDTRRFAALSARLWGRSARPGVRAVGRGRVYQGMPLETVLEAERIGPDVSIEQGPVDLSLLQLHRVTEAGAHIYYVNSRADRPATVELGFAVDGRVPELWDAESGRARPLGYKRANGRTIVPLALGAKGAAFIVFRKPAEAPSLAIPAARSTRVLTVAGPWTVSFEKDRGAPPPVRFERLVPLTARPEPGIRYFSGRATYRTEFALAALTAGRLQLDLGEVRDIAEVRLNGRRLGLAWHAPYVIDLGDAARPGINRLEIDVTNLWRNRVIGDLQPGTGQKVSFTARDLAGQQRSMFSGLGLSAGSALLPSGLIGPVTLNEAR